VGVLLACRSEWRPGWSALRPANPLLWAGVASELLVLSALVLIPRLGSLFAMAPFPARNLTWMAMAPVLILLADAAHKHWRQNRR
jgi:hypothetical protein